MMGAGNVGSPIGGTPLTWDDYGQQLNKNGPGGAANAVIPVLTPDYTGGSL